MDIAGFLYGFGALQGVILAGILLAMRSGHRVANAIMAVLVMTIALNVLQRMVLHMGALVEVPTVALGMYPLRYTWGPLLYLYAFSLSGGQLRISQWLHFLPAVLLFLMINVPILQLTSLQQQDLVSYLTSLRNDPVQEALIWSFLHGHLHFRLMIDFHLNSLVFILQFSGYCLLLLAQLRRHNRRLQQHFSSIEHMNLRWLRLLTIACLVFLGLFFVLNRLPMMLIEQFDRWTVQANLHMFFLIVLIYGIGIAALFQPNLVSGVVQARDSEPNRNEPDGSELPAPDASTAEPSNPQGSNAEGLNLEPAASAPVASTEAVSGSGSLDEGEAGGDTAALGKYERSGLSMEAAQHYQIALMEIMQEKQLYLDGELTLPGLAEAAGLTTHQVSQVINGQMNQNFFSFVNNYRIQLAKRMLLDPKTSAMPIVELAFEVGFQSKSAFYEAFKRVANMTPTQFKRTGLTSSE
mgnify:CR=1 FL=1